MHRRNKPGANHQRSTLHGWNHLDVLLRPELAGHDDYHDGWSAIRPRSAKLQAHDQIVVTEQDEQRLRALVQQHRPYIDPGMLTQLEAELNRAWVVDQTHVPADVVTMNSRVLYEDVDNGALAEVRLVYHDPVHPGESHVSVLAPIGAALLGLSAGQSIAWPYGGRDPLRLRVAALLYQPESAGAAA